MTHDGLDGGEPDGVTVGRCKTGVQLRLGQLNEEVAIDSSIGNGMHSMVSYQCRMIVHCHVL